MIVLPTREINIWNPTGGQDDGEDDPEMAVAASGLFAHISAPSGGVQPGTTSSAVAISAHLLCDVTPALQAGSVIEDLGTGNWYGVDWCRTVTDFGGLGHIVAGLTDRQGVQS